MVANAVYFRRNCAPISFLTLSTFFKNRENAHSYSVWIFLYLYPPLFFSTLSSAWVALLFHHIAIHKWSFVRISKNICCLFYILLSLRQISLAVEKNGTFLWKLSKWRISRVVGGRNLSFVEESCQTVDDSRRPCSTGNPNKPPK